MPKHSFLFIWLVLLYSVASLASGAPASCYDWIFREKIRGGYMGAALKPEGLAQMKAVGMNLLMPKFGGLQAPPTEENIKQLQAWGEAARTYSLRLMPVFNFRGSNTEALLSDKREVAPTGQIMPRTPCPLDEAFWEKYIIGRAVWLAEHASQLGLQGCIIDPEMYAADHTVYTSPCYCADCWREFGQAAGRALPDLPAAQRASWLQENGLQERFVAHFIGCIRSFCARLEQQCHARQPDFLLGVLLLDYPLAFMEGMARGLGTETHPVLAFSESTYSSGYTEYIPQQIQKFAAMPAHVLFVPGLWLQQFPTENLAEQFYACAVSAAGYWIYTYESLFGDPAKLPQGYHLPEPGERYWEAMKVANAEIDKFMATDGAYVSALKVRPFEPPPLVLTYNDIPIPALQPAPEMPPFSMGPVTCPRLRHRHVLFVFAQAQETVTVRITNIQLANYRPGTTWLVVRPDREKLSEGYIKLKESQEVSFLAYQAGVYMIIVSSRNNSHAVEMLSKQPYSFAASEKLKFTVNGQMGRLYFYVPQGAQQFAIVAKAAGQAAGRGGKLTVYGPDGQPVAYLEGDLGSEEKMSITVPPGAQGRVWGLTGEDISNDLTVYFQGDVSPYVSPDPTKLLTPKP